MQALEQKVDAPKRPPACSVIPQVPPIVIPTPFGIDLKSVVDPSKGPPSDCTLAHSLILQLTPMLAGFTCILKVLNVIGKMEQFAKSPLTKAGDLLAAIGQMSDCLGLVNPLPWLGMIKGILQLILAYLGCLIQGLESIRKLKIGIDLNAEGGTPLLLNTLDCAKGNGDTSLAALMSAMAAIEPLMKLVDLIAGIVGLDLGGGLPSFNLSAGADPLQPLIDFHDTLQEVVDSLPA